MRTTLYTFFLTTALLLTPYAFLHAGTDDSGLQVFTVDFSKQLGESADVAQEDTLFSPYCYNMFSSGNGLTTFKTPEGSNYEWGGPATKIIDFPLLTPSHCLVRKKGTDGNIEVYLHFTPLNSDGGARMLLVKDAYSTDFNCYFGGDTIYVTLGSAKMLAITDDYSYTTSSINLPAAPYSSALFKNRLFICNDNYLYYSAAQNFENFSNTATAGGTTRIFDTNYIYKLISTKYGLYIFADNGIFLMSGENKNSFVIEKISNLSFIQAATNYKDIVYFTTNSLVGNKIFALSGITISEIAELPYYFLQTYNDLKVVADGDVLLLSAPDAGQTIHAFNLKNKTWFRNGEFNVIGSDYFYIKNTATGYKIYQAPQFKKFNLEYDEGRVAYATPQYPWAYQTSWLTLDGNASNRKEIDRIEFDYQGGTTSVYLYYAYGNGSSSYSNTTLTAPTNTRLSTYVWNAPIGRQQSNRFYLYFLSSGTQTMTTNYILKQARIYYRNIGNYKTNSLR